MKKTRTLSTVVLVVSCIIVASFGPAIMDNARDAMIPMVEVSMTTDEGIIAHSGDGYYKAGDVVSVHADVKNGYYFDGWYDDRGRLLSKDYNYMFMAENICIHGRSAPGYTVDVASTEGFDWVKGGGSHPFGSPAHLDARVTEGYTFDGWYDMAGKLLSRDLSYTPPDRDLVAIARTYCSPVVGDHSISVDWWPTWYDASSYCVITDWFSHDVIYSFMGKNTAGHQVDAGMYEVTFFSKKFYGAVMLDSYTVEFDGPTVQHYVWHSGGQYRHIDFETDCSTYSIYEDSNISRAPQTDTLRYQFIKSESPSMRAFADAMLEQTQGMTDLQRADYVLDFVQQCIEYQSDPEGQGVAEHWKFPYETLMEHRGDCEDSAVLYATLMHLMGVDTALLLFIGDEYKGKAHVAVGLALDPPPSPMNSFDDSGKKYYYCETTSRNYDVGDTVPGYDHPQVIHLGEADPHGGHGRFPTGEDGSSDDPVIIN